MENERKAIRIAIALTRGILKQERILHRLMTASQSSQDESDNSKTLQNGPLKLYDKNNSCLTDGTMVNAEVIVDETNVMWLSGTFKGKLLSNCMFADGVFKGGDFNGGKIGEFSGSFESGNFNSGMFVEGGVFKGGNFIDGTFNGGTWIGGNWKATNDKWIWGKDKNGVRRETPPPWNSGNLAVDDGRYANFSGKIVLFDEKNRKSTDVNPTVRNATFTKKGNVLEWEDGTWSKGTWEDGTWEDGTWEDGTWKNGTWQGGNWKHGDWKSGFDKNGNRHPNSKTARFSDSPDQWEEMDATRESSYVDFTGNIDYNGIAANVKKATFTLSSNGIIWKSGIWKTGTWKDGTWESGEWKSGTWIDGIWCSGTWNTGFDSNGNKHSDSPDNWDSHKQIADAVGTYANFSGTVKAFGTHGIASKASFEILDDGRIIWDKGTWEKGVLDNCDWKGGKFSSGVFSHGIFHSGVFDRGMFNKGSVFENGTWNGNGVWSDKSEWRGGTDRNGNRMTTPPSEWRSFGVNRHHPNRDMLIDQFIHYGSLVRTTFTWDEKKPNNPKIFRIYESGVAETINPFKNLLITRMTLSPDHLLDCFCMPEYLGLDDDGKPMVGNTESAGNIPSDLSRRAGFFKSFDYGEWLEDEPNIPSPVRDGSGNFTQYYNDALNEMNRNGLAYIP